ncbi:hypothetical protein U1Q18_039559 [Sarracenia purpurea var. burkii]
MEAMTVRRYCWESLIIRFMTWYEAALSSPLVGSSRKRSFGRVRISMQMLTLLFCPPLRPLELHTGDDVVVGLEKRFEFWYLVRKEEADARMKIAVCIIR